MQHLSFLEAFLLTYIFVMFALGAVTLIIAMKWRSSTLFMIGFAMFWVVGASIVALDFLHPNAVPYHITEIGTMVLLLLMVAMGVHLERNQPHLTSQSFDGRRSRW